MYINDLALPQTSVLLTSPYQNVFKSVFKKLVNWGATEFINII